MRSSPTFSEVSLSPSFLTTTPEKNPRMECCCQSVAFMTAAMVAPFGDCSMAITAACFESDRAGRRWIRVDGGAALRGCCAFALAFCLVAFLDIGLAFLLTQQDRCTTASPRRPRGAGGSNWC